MHSDVDDRESLNTQANTVLEEEAARIRTAMFHDSAHSMQQVPVHGPLEIDLAGNATHRPKRQPFQPASGWTRFRAPPATERRRLPQSGNRGCISGTSLQLLLDLDGPAITGMRVLRDVQ